MLLFRVMKCGEPDISLDGKSLMYIPTTSAQLRKTRLVIQCTINVNVPFNDLQGTRGGYVHEVSGCKWKQLRTMGLVVDMYMRSLPS